MRTLANDRPKARRICLQFLSERATAEPLLKSKGGVEAAMVIWDNLRPSLEDLDESGGGERSTEDEVSCALAELAETLEKIRLPAEDRARLLDEIIDFIRRGNSGMVDELYEAAYAASRSEGELRDLARR